MAMAKGLGVMTDLNLASILRVIRGFSLEGGDEKANGETLRASPAAVSCYKNLPPLRAAAIYAALGRLMRAAPPNDPDLKEVSRVN
jgi:hypothetical protein